MTLDESFNTYYTILSRFFTIHFKCYNSHLEASTFDTQVKNEHFWVHKSAHNLKISYRQLLSLALQDGPVALMNIFHFKKKLI